MKTEELIDQLGNEMRSIRVPSPARLTLIWLATSFMITVLGVAMFLGVRSDLAVIVYAPQFILMLSALTGIFVSAAVVCFRAAIPGSEISPYLSLAPFALYAVFAASLLPPLTDGGTVADLSPLGARCTLVLFTLSLAPVIFLFALVRSLACITPNRIGKFAGISTLALGTFGLSLYCGSHESPHLLLYHALPVLALAFVVQGVSARYLRW